MERDDETLVRAAKAGSKPAFERLYERFAPVIHGVLVARLPFDEVDDVLQEVFLTAFRRLPQLRETHAFAGWLLSIARSRAADFYQHQIPAAVLSQDYPASERVDGHPAEEVLDLLRSLPGAYRETLALRFVEGLTGAEIAKRTGLTTGSVRVNLSRGMQLLRELLEKRVKL